LDLIFGDQTNQTITVGSLNARFAAAEAADGIFFIDGADKTKFRARRLRQS
jgi:hypothetical protein